MTYTPTWMRLCDCRCPLHHGFPRTTYNDDGCACAVTCTTQPMTLLAEQWNCALFLNHAGALWSVNRLPGSQWDWSDSNHISEGHVHHQAGLIVQRSMRHLARILVATARNN